jgi:hypothetical protein
VKVYDNTAAPTSWGDLDLSGIVGKNRALVFVKIKNRDSMAITTYLVRIKGETEEVGDTLGYLGMNNRVTLRNNHIAHFAMETNENGIIQWTASSAGTTDIWVLGYIR